MKASSSLTNLSEPEVAFEQLTRTSTGTLKAIVALHWLETPSQILALLVASQWLAIELPYRSLAAIVVGFLLWNIGSLYTLNRAPNVSMDWQVSAQLVVEIFVLTGLLYFSGGATNPFVSLYLLPIALASMVLPLRFVLPIAALAIIAYSILLFLYEPLGSQHMHHDQSDEFNLHVIGMWVNFLISTSVCVASLSFLANLARKRAENIADLREQVVQDNHLVTMGGMAAAATHSLSTPLSTVALVLDQIIAKSSPEQQKQAGRAREQIDICRERLSQTLANFRLERFDEATRVRMDDKVKNILTTWKLLHPAIEVEIGPLPTQQIVTTAAFDYSLNTLLDNAAEANQENGSSRIWVRGRENALTLDLEIEDEGGGPLPDLTKPGSHKVHGSGVGLSIAMSNFKQLGAELSFEMGERGCIARVRFNQ